MGVPEDIVARDKRFHMLGSTIPASGRRYVGGSGHARPVEGVKAILMHNDVDCGDMRVGDVFETKGGKVWIACEPYVPNPNRQCFFLGVDLLNIEAAVVLIRIDSIFLPVVFLEDVELLAAPHDRSWKRRQELIDCGERASKLAQLLAPPEP